MLVSMLLVLAGFAGVDDFDDDHVRGLDAVSYQERIPAERRHKLPKALFADPAPALGKIGQGRGRIRDQLSGLGRGGRIPGGEKPDQANMVAIGVPAEPNLSAHLGFAK